MALALSSAATATTAHIPVEKFAELPIMSRPLLSPDGHRIVARSTVDGRTTLELIDPDHPEKVVKSIPLGQTRIKGLYSAGNHRLLLQFQITYKLSNGGEIPFLRLVAIDLDTSTSRPLDRKSRGTYAGDVLFADPSGDWALVASQNDAYSYPSVKRVDLATGDATLVEKDRIGVWDWYVDNKGVVRAGIAYKGPWWTIWYREKPQDALKAIHGTFPKDDGSTVDRFIFRGDKSWIVTNERSGRFGLYKYDTKTGSVGETIFEHPEVDVSDVDYDAITGDVKRHGGGRHVRGHASVSKHIDNYIHVS